MVSYSEYNIDVPAGSHGEVRTVCPECSGTRKPQNQNRKELAVNTDKQTWLCHHCGWSGGLHEKPEPQYIRPEYPEPDLPDGVIKYFAGRGISADILVDMKIGYQGATGNRPGAIMFPYYKNGQVVAIKYRTHDKRMWQSKGPEPCFYNFDNAGGDTLVICEGEIDCLSWIEAGVTNCVSVPNGAPTPGAQNLDKKLKFLDLEYINKFERIVLASDNDQPGQYLVEVLAEKIGKYRCALVAYPDGCKDANEVLLKHGPKKLREVYQGAKLMPVDGLYTASDVEQQIFDLYHQGLRPGLSTGWPILDQFYTVRPAEMTIITGIPSSGKSTWLDALTVNLNRQHGWKIAFCSPENWPIERHIASIAEKIMLKSFTGNGFSGRISESELRTAIAEISGKFFFTQLQDEDMTLDGVLKIMQAAISRHGVKGIVLDPWNELEYHRPQNISETEFISMALGKIRRFARTNNVHIWIVAHPTKLMKNKDGSYPVPRLYDISGSAHFYNKADNGISIYRRGPNNPQVEIHINKIRFREVGKLGNICMNFSMGCGVYHEIPASEQKGQTDQAPF